MADGHSPCPLLATISILINAIQRLICAQNDRPVNNRGACQHCAFQLIDRQLAELRCRCDDSRGRVAVKKVDSPVSINR